MDRYLTMTETVVVGENPGEYLIKGTDDEGDAAVATVTVKKVLGIEKAPDDPSGPPNPIIGPAGPVYYVETDFSSKEVVLEIENPPAVSGLVYKYTVSPVGSGSTIELPAEINLDRVPDEGVIVLTYSAEYAGKYVTIEFWTESGSESSTPYKLIFYFRST